MIGTLLAAATIAGLLGIIIWEALVALVPLDPAACPDCGTPLEVETVDQPALLRHGGYGAMERRVVRYCPACPWVLDALREEVRP